VRYEINGYDSTTGTPGHLRTIERTLIRTSMLDAMDAAKYLKNMGYYTDIEIIRLHAEHTEPMRHWRYLPTESDPFKSYWKSIL
jgi:hypothetical protein